MAPLFDQSHQHVAGDQFNAESINFWHATTSDLALLAQVNHDLAGFHGTSPLSSWDLNHGSPDIGHHGHHDHHHGHHSSYSCSDTSHL